VVNVYEQLREEGYLAARVGSGTVVSENLPDDFMPAPHPVRSAEHGRMTEPRRIVRPFLPIAPSIDEFPMELWARCNARAIRSAGSSMLGDGNEAGLLALREQIAAYLGASRGVSCSARQIVVTSGTQQSLDLVARILLRPGDTVWVEDPGYVGAVDAFRNAKADIVPVPVDEHGLNPEAGRRVRTVSPKAIYLTPAHQFGLGTTLSLPRRLDLIRWSQQVGAAIIEDDYDSEFRFSGAPVPALRGIDRADSVFLLGSFNKVLFPGLRLGYMVVPEAWLETVLRFRFQVDRDPPALTQSALALFLAEGHFVRHLRRMRELYGRRRAVLQEASVRYLRGILELPDIAAGLNTPAFLRNGLTGADAAARASLAGIEAWPLSRLCLRRKDLQGLLLGFAAFREREIRAGVVGLARALE
jgi:GntR family transcriptional regulator/MocR family aminotransferase